MERRLVRDLFGDLDRCLDLLSCLDAELDVSLLDSSSNFELDSLSTFLSLVLCLCSLFGSEFVFVVVVDDVCAGTGAGAGAFLYPYFSLSIAAMAFGSLSAVMLDVELEAVF